MSIHLSVHSTIIYWVPTHTLYVCVCACAYKYTEHPNPGQEEAWVNRVSPASGIMDPNGRGLHVHQQVQPRQRLLKLQQGRTKQSESMGEVCMAFWGEGHWVGSGVAPLPQVEIGKATTLIRGESRKIQGNFKRPKIICFTCGTYPTWNTTQP